MQCPNCNCPISTAKALTSMCQTMFRISHVCPTCGSIFFINVSDFNKRQQRSRNILMLLVLLTTAIAVEGKAPRWLFSGCILLLLIVGTLYSVRAYLNTKTVPIIDPISRYKLNQSRVGALFTSLFLSATILDKFLGDNADMTLLMSPFLLFGFWLLLKGSQP